MAGDTNTLKDWCADMCFNVLAEHIRQRQQAGLKVESRILELRNCEVRMSCARRPMTKESRNVKP